MIVIEFELQDLPKTMNARMHWRVRAQENQKWRGWVIKICRPKRPLRPLERARLILTRCSSTPIDFDNLVSGFKPVVDGLVRAGVLVDDDWQTIGVPEFRWEKCSPRAGKIRVRVEEVELNQQCGNGEQDAA